MGQTRKQRHRDRCADSFRQRYLDAEDVGRSDRVFRITDGERQEMAKTLRYIDDARRALEEQQNPANREIIRELHASADRVFDLLNDLEEIDR